MSKTRELGSAIKDGQGRKATNKEDTTAYVKTIDNKRLAIDDYLTNLKIVLVTS